MRNASEPPSTTLPSCCCVCALSFLRKVPTPPQAAAAAGSPASNLVHEACGRCTAPLWRSASHHVRTYRGRQRYAKSWFCFVYHHSDWLLEHAGHFVTSRGESGSNEQRAELSGSLRFQQAARGIVPDGSLLAVNGTLYGTTNFGGVPSNRCYPATGCGTVYRLQAARATQTVLYRFNGPKDRHTAVCGTDRPRRHPLWNHTDRRQEQRRNGFRRHAFGLGACGLYRSPEKTETIRARA